MLSEKVIKNKAREFRQGGKDMRIAMLTNNYRPFVGGVPISVERQAEELIKLGHQVTVFAPMYGETQEEREAVLAADVSAPEQVVRYGTQKRKMDNGMVYPSFYPSEIMEAFERDEFDCIHVHHPMFVGPCALYLKRKYRLPLIYTYHTRYEDYLHYIPGLRVDEKSFVLKKEGDRTDQDKDHTNLYELVCKSVRSRTCSVGRNAEDIVGIWYEKQIRRISDRT